MVTYGNVGYFLRRRSWGSLPRLGGKVVIVTGAKGGLGRAIADGLRFWHDRAPRPEHYLGLNRESEEERRTFWETVEGLSGTPA
jgi:hypothetical protein